MKKEVIICAPMFLNFGGGISSYSRALALTIGNDKKYYKNLRLYSRLDHFGSFNSHRVIGFGSLPKFIQPLMLGVCLFLSALISRPNLIISTHINFGPFLYWIYKILGIQYILVAHGIEINSSLSYSRKLALHNAKSVWAVSRWTKKQLEEIDVDSDTIKIIPNTVSAKKFNIGPKNSELIKRYNIQTDEKIILTVARLESKEAYKGYDRIIYALKLLPPTLKTRFLIVGYGSDSNRILSIAKALDVHNRVTLCGFISDHELVDHYRIADVFALPSKGEGFGIVFLEAMACGIPVLGGNEDGACDALLDGKLGLLVNPSNVNEIAHGLEKILNKKGDELWFSPQRLRDSCLDTYGERSFKQKILNTLINIEINKNLKIKK
ncbi:MAG: glycosyltransferase family 4 protein [Betaproteobacteria bacterium]|nr:glycosyltransferase family 4 protein [Betaproteobacteria bacterium]